MPCVSPLVIPIDLKNLFLLGSGASKSQPTGTEEIKASNVERSVNVAMDSTPTDRAAASRIGDRTEIAVVSKPRDQHAAIVVGDRERGKV